MCGFISTYGNTVDKSKIISALTAINHRGPDEQNYWQEKSGIASLGHVRLSIMGLDNGLQPISDAEGDIQLIVNGEFYDFEKIRRELKAQGCVFRYDSDSEIALHLYKTAGMAGLEKLRGEFSLVLFDTKHKKLIAMRDRIGIKPLYWAEYEGTFYVGSEIKALLAAGLPAEWDVDSYVNRQLYLDNGTLFNRVKSVPPGHFLSITPGGSRLQCYWDIEYEKADNLNSNDNPTESEMTKKVHDTVRESLELRLRSDVPMAFYLSGGIDSSALLGMSSDILGKPVDAFNLSFTDMDDFDENRFARLAAEKTNARFNTVEINQDTLADNFEKALWHNEIPFFNAHGVAKYILSGSVKKAGFKAVITGEGADELFAGYPHFRRDMLLYNTENQDSEVINPLLNKLRKSESKAGDNTNPADVEWIYSQLGHGVSWLDKYSGGFKDLQKLYSNDIAGAYKDIEPYKEFFNRIDHRKLKDIDPVHRSMYLWAKSYLPNLVCTTLGDRMEMANSIEGRVPLLDHKLIELSASIPVSMKIKGGVEKHIFREAMKPYIPNELYKRKKHYFRAPPSSLLQDGRLFELTQDTLRSSLLEKIPFFDAAKVRKLLDDLPNMPIHEQARLDPLIMEITSLCMLQDQFNITLPSNIEVDAVAA